MELGVRKKPHGVVRKRRRGHGVDRVRRKSHGVDQSKVSGPFEC